MDNSVQLAPGTVVKFAAIVAPGDADARMVVVEDRGEHVLVRDIPAIYMAIVPTAVYSKSDLEIA